MVDDVVLFSLQSPYYQLTKDWSLCTCWTCHLFRWLHITHLEVHISCYLIADAKFILVLSQSLPPSDSTHSNCYGLQNCMHWASIYISTQIQSQPQRVHYDGLKVYYQSSSGIVPSALLSYLGFRLQMNFQICLITTSMFTWWLPLNGSLSLPDRSPPVHTLITTISIPKLTQLHPLSPYLSLLHIYLQVYPQTGWIIASIITSS
jgi:hypothetical protein